MKIDPQPWMRAPETVAVFDLLNKDGAEGRFVGGCVRDALLDRPVRDVDLATTLLPDEVVKRAGVAGFKAVPTGIDHGTVTVVVEHHPFEVTTLREDVSTDGRRATVAYTRDWHADAARRDFTMNALTSDAEGVICDYFGGVEDAVNGRVRFVGDPDARLHEDVLRLLRFFRFHAHYGQGAPDGAGYDACARAAKRLPGLSAERVRHEVLRLLEARDPVPAWRAMQRGGVVDFLPGDLKNTDILQQLVALENVEGADPLRRLAALAAYHNDAGAFADQYRLSNAEKKRLGRIASLVWGGASVPRDGAALQALFGGAGTAVAGPVFMYRAFIYRVGVEAAKDAALLSLAAGTIAGRAAESDVPHADTRKLDIWQGILRELADWDAPNLPIAGRDIEDLGIARGPRIGTLLADVEEWWLANGMQADRQACLDHLRAIIQADGKDISG